MDTCNLQFNFSQPHSRIARVGVWITQTVRFLSASAIFRIFIQKTANKILFAYFDTCTLFGAHEINGSLIGRYYSIQAQNLTKTNFFHVWIWMLSSRWYETCAWVFLPLQTMVFRMQNAINVAKSNKKAWSFHFCYY